jgi:hypothetical protein
MTPTIMAFFFGMLVGGLGGTLLIGFFFLHREPERTVNDIQKTWNASSNTLTAKPRISRALHALWGTLR